MTESAELALGTVAPPFEVHLPSRDSDVFLVTSQEAGDFALPNHNTQLAVAGAFDGADCQLSRL